MLKVSVQDTGIGIKKEDRAKLFKMFGKLEESAKMNTSGIGLGLSICRTIVEMFEGSINLDSDYMNGAKFIFTMKASDVLA